MSIRYKNEVEDKIEELKKQLEPKQQSLRYNINNKQIQSSIIDNMNDIINRNLIHAKIDALKWAIKKKKVL